MTAPEPPQREQGCEIEKRPWSSPSTPRPWHCGHTRGVVPGRAPVPAHVVHGLEVGTSSCTCAPSTACWKERSTSVSRSRPRCVGGLRLVRRRVAAPGARPERGGGEAGEEAEAAGV